MHVNIRTVEQIVVGLYILILMREIIKSSCPLIKELYKQYWTVLLRKDISDVQCVGTLKNTWSETLCEDFCNS